MDIIHISTPNQFGGYVVRNDGSELDFYPLGSTKEVVDTIRLRIDHPKDYFMIYGVSPEGFLVPLTCGTGEDFLNENLVPA